MGRGMHDGCSPAIAGVDRNTWAVQEANWTYRTLGLRGQAKTGDVVRSYPTVGSGAPEKTAVLLAYTVNELPPDTRALLLDRVSQSTRAGARLLIVEPIARGVTTWWDEWTTRLAPDGARADEWRFPATLPAADAADRQGSRPRSTRAPGAHDLQAVGLSPAGCRVILPAIVCSRD